MFFYEPHNNLYRYLLMFSKIFRIYSANLTVLKLLKTSLVILTLLSFESLAMANDDSIHDQNQIDNKLIVIGRSAKQLGEDISASEGSISLQEILQRPVLRTGEILEFVPGMVTTQHSGSGKANQYFLRGFNLDHGTDFSTYVDGMPVNMRTHGHGQGYTDLNFIVPEFVQRIDYRKGPYHAKDGDFSNAGSADFVVADLFSKSMIQMEVGENNYRRSVFAHEFDLEGDQLLVGAEDHQYDGPWRDVQEDVGKNNLLIKYINKTESSMFSVTFMGYENSWNSADQIPSRGVTNQLIDSLGSIDEDVGGESSRYSLSLKFNNGDWQSDAYIIDSNLDLFSNFTYFLEDPVNGDEFEQVDDRKVFGGQLIRKFTTDTENLHIDHTFGLQYRFDNIDKVGLYKTAQRQRIGVVREDSVDEESIGMFWAGELDVSEYLSTSFGVRYDYLDVDVISDNPLNGGTASDGLLSFKAGLRYQLQSNLYSYLNIGQSFHSNDARGATISVDPNSGDSVEPVDLMVRGEGAEIGMHLQEEDQYNLSMSLWYLELDSELLFVGDAGNTEPGRASRRQGVELAGYYWWGETFSSDIELAWSHARFKEPEANEGNHIEGALPFVASIGLNWMPLENWRLGMRIRHFGKRPLDSFAEQKSDDFKVVNFAVTYDYQPWQIEVKALNLFDSDDHDIDYFYASRLPNEVFEGIEDNHFHPIEPRTFRIQIRYVF